LNQLNQLLLNQKKMTQEKNQ